MTYIKYEGSENWVLWVCPDAECDTIVHDPGNAGPLRCDNYDVHTLGNYPELVRTPVVAVDEANRRIRESYDVGKEDAVPTFYMTCSSPPPHPTGTRFGR